MIWKKYRDCFLMSLSCSMKFETNKSDLNDVEFHLKLVDTQFVPNLSSYINIKAYSEKLISLAVRCEIWFNHDLVGLLAYYKNDNEAFVTNLSILPSHNGQGLGSKLFSYFEEQLALVDITSIRLEVKSMNHKAIKFYHKMGLKNCERRWWYDYLD